jgi:cell division protein FtsI (penicillin-binding protein 3)
VLGQVDVDNAGLSGLEKKYDDLLTGVPGELKVEQAPGGRTIAGGDNRITPAQRGDDLVLTIDRSLQYETERALGAQILAEGAKGGTAVVTRPDTGEVLALANLSVDPSTHQIVARGDDAAVTSVFEPGSVNKVITVAGAIEEGLVAPSTQIEVPDQYQVGDHLFTDHDPHPTAPWSVTRILTESSNIGTIKIAQALGKDRLDEYLRKFGLGQKTALDLPYESAGILRARDKYNATSIGSIPIGQGIAVTAMQMIAAYNVLANDGVYVPPKLVQETIDEQGVHHRTDAGDTRRVVSAATAEQLRDMLVNVVHEGTGTRGGITGYNVAGKTGTARKPLATGGYGATPGDYRYVATFAGFVPAEKPALSVIVVIDEPTGDIYGGSVAAPVFADIAQYGLQLFHIPPPLVEKAAAPDTAAALDTQRDTGGGKVRADAATTTSTTVTTPAGGGGAHAGHPPTGSGGG